MDIYINQSDSKVQAIDGQTLLDPKVMCRIVDAVIRELEQRQSREKRSEMDRRFRSGVSSDR